MRKKLGMGLGALLFGYLIVLPLFWPKPTLEIETPVTVPLGENASIEVILRAWHSNVAVTSVRFYVDFYASTAKGPEGLLNPMLILEDTPRDFLGFFSRNPFTRPWRRSLVLQVPLEEAARAGLLGPGVLQGKIDVNITYAKMGKKRMGGSAARALPTMLSAPFTMTIIE